MMNNQELMKKCTNCSHEMKDNYKVRMNNAPLARIIIKNGIRKNKIKVYVCPNCGKVDLYK